MTRDQIGTTLREVCQISTFAEEIWRSHGDSNPRGITPINGPPHGALGNPSDKRQFGQHPLAHPITEVAHVNIVSGPNRDHAANASHVIQFPLQNGQHALIDAADLALVKGFKWRARRGKHDSTWYAIRTLPRAERHICSTETMHRRILGAKRGEVVDHQDGNGLNNTRTNLRLCTVRDNNRNVKKHQGGTSAYKGVSWHPKGQKWTAVVRYHGKNVYLGLFKNEVSAAFAYDRKARELFGEFARPNFAPLPVLWMVQP